MVPFIACRRPGTDIPGSDFAVSLETTGQQGRRPLLVVLTGGVASGKSTTSDCFARLGVEIIDTDLIAREIVQPGSPALAEIVAHFGPEVLSADGTLNRRYLREKVFSHKQSRKQLESLLHPRIEARVRQRIAVANGPYVVVVVPLLVESGLFGDADCVIVVDIAEDEQIRRLCKRDDVDAAHARAMLAAQASRQQRLQVADEVLDNTATPKQLDKAVKRLHRKLLQRAKHHDEPRQGSSE
jgi:dephospho-CoA kinase